MDVGRLGRVLRRSRVPKSTPGPSKIEAKTVQNGLEMEGRIPNPFLGASAKISETQIFGFWAVLGLKLGAKLGPSWHQKSKKIDIKIDQNFDAF